MIKNYIQPTGNGPDTNRSASQEACQIKKLHHTTMDFKNDNEHTYV